MSRLNEQQRVVAQVITDLFRHIQQLPNPAGSDHDEVFHLIHIAGAYAHGLHLHLKYTGNEPKFQDWFIQNRQCQPDDPEFYRHYHALEDLVPQLLLMMNSGASERPTNQG